MLLHGSYMYKIILGRLGFYVVYVLIYLGDTKPSTCAFLDEFISFRFMPDHWENITIFIKINR